MNFVSVMRNIVGEQKANKIAPMDALPKGTISEVFGAVSCGKTLFLQTLLADASACGECCAVVDSQGAFDPLSASRAGVDLRRLLWVRGNHHIDSTFKAVDLILPPGGFRVVLLHLCSLPLPHLHHFPL